MNIYVGNLSPDVVETDLRDAFGAFGQVSSVKVITDKYTGKSRGFGFVEMPSQTDAESAIAGLKDKELKGSTLNVNEARPRPQGQRSGAGRGGAGRGGRGRGGGGGGGGRRSW